MAFSEQVRDALLRVHAAHRALKIARGVQETQRLLVADFPDTAGFLIDDVAEALVQRLQEAEADLAALIAAAGDAITDPVNGHVLTMRTNDRRDDPRPLFVLTRLHGLGAASPAQQQRYAQRVRP
jgi:preprotein translocase subunit Sec63